MLLHVFKGIIHDKIAQLESSKNNGEHLTRSDPSSHNPRRKFNRILYNESDDEEINETLSRLNALERLNAIDVDQWNLINDFNRPSLEKNNKACNQLSSDKKAE